MVDIHSHIINNVDDGAKDIDMAINMLKKAEKIGMRGIVATPHYLRGVYNFEFNEIQKYVDDLREKARENNIGIDIYCGQEIYYTNNIANQYIDKIIGTINNSRYMLIEFPMRDFDEEEIINNIYELQIRGIVPIIAHPERYKKLMKKPEIINKFAEEGYLFQLNAGSITGQFGRDVKKLASLFLKNNIYSFIGSDAHRDMGRDTDISAALDMLEVRQRRMFRVNSRMVIENEVVEFEGKEVKGKKLLGIW